MTTLSGARIVSPHGVLEPGWVDIESGRIVDLGQGSAPHGAADLGGAWLLPGFIDIHVHGGGGYDFASSLEQMRAGVAFHRMHGTSRILVSLSAAPVERLKEQLGWVAMIVDEEPESTRCVQGAHLEGPFLARSERRGAQNLADLLKPDLELMHELVDAARGALRMVTLAPELPGGLALVSYLVRQRLVVAVGHTDASYEQATMAFECGATVATHLFNGMPPLHHRDPGAVLAALNGGAYCELISDGLHVSPEVVRALASRYPELLVLITDAIRPAGMSDGVYGDGERAVKVRNGEARLVASGGLAGSTLTMDRALRCAVTDCGVPITVAAAAAATTPATLLGLDDRYGAIAVGRYADFVLLDDDLRIIRTMTGGQWAERL